MRTTLAMLLLAATAEAAPVVIDRPILPATTLQRVNLAAVPRSCAQIARQANAPRIAVAQGARIALAQCLATDRIAAQKDLIDSQLSMEQLEQSIAPSFALLDAAIASGDPALMLEAQDAKGRIYGALATRMLATVPALPASPSDEAMQLHDQRAALLATWIQPWRDKAREAFAGAISIGRQSQGPVSKDPVASAALADSQQQLARP